MERKTGSRAGARWRCRLAPSADVNNAEATWWSTVAALRWTVFWRGRVDERLLERTSGQEDTMLGRWTGISPQTAAAGRSNDRL